MTLYPTLDNVLFVLNYQDWIVFSAVLVLTICSVFYGLHLRKKIKTCPDDSRQGWLEYLLMGRKLTLPLFVATLVATWYGKIFGVTQIAFEQGVYSFIAHGFFWYITYGLFAFFMVKRIRRARVLTMPELLEKLIGVGPARFSAFLIFFKTLPVVYAMSVGIFLQFLFGISFSWATGLGVLFVVFYSLFGGFRAVVFSDFIQFIVMYLGIISVVGFSIIEFGGFSYLTKSLPPSYFQPTGTVSVSSTLVWFFIAFSTTFLNPTFYQRCFAANSTKTAVMGIGISTFFWIGFDICQLLIGLYAKAAIPDANSLNACLYYAIQILPYGWKGFFLSAVLATILSTLDSFLLISSTVLSYDLHVFRKFSAFKAHFLTLVLTGCATFLLALLYDGHIETVWKVFKGLFATCLLAPLLWSCIKPHSLTTSDFKAITLGVMGVTLFWYFKGASEMDVFYAGNGVALLILSGRLLYASYIKKLMRKTAEKPKKLNIF